MQDRSSTVSWALATFLHVLLLIWVAYGFESLPPRPRQERLLAKTIVLDQEVIAMGETLHSEQSPEPAMKAPKMAQEETVVPDPEPVQPKKKELDEPQPTAPDPEPEPEALPDPTPEPEPAPDPVPEQEIAIVEHDPEPVKVSEPTPKPEPKKKPEPKTVKPKPKPKAPEPKEKPKPKPKAPVTKAKPKKTEEKPKTKPKPAPQPKPKPKPEAKPKPKPVVKNPLKKETPPPPVDDKKPLFTDKQIALLTKARQTAAKMEKAELKKGSGTGIKPAKLGVLNIESSGPPGYQKALASKLRSLLTLPEYGDVKLKLTLARSGKVLKIEILSAKSKRNQSYVEEHLAGASMPAFGENFAGSNQETFTLTLKSE